jgi:hypothetical protein
VRRCRAAHVVIKGRHSSVGWRSVGRQSMRRQPAGWGSTHRRRGHSAGGNRHSGGRLLGGTRGEEVLEDGERRPR